MEEAKERGGRRVKAAIATPQRISTGARLSPGSSTMEILVRIAIWFLIPRYHDDDMYGTFLRIEILLSGGESKLTTAALLRHDAVQGGL